MTKKTKKPLAQAARLALFAAMAAGCATVLQPTPGWSATMMSAEDCRELALEDLMQAITDGICLIDALPAAGPTQVANRGTTGSHDNDRDPPAGGGGSGGAGDSEGDDGGDGEGDDGGDPPDNGDDGDGDDGGDTGYNPCTCHHHHGKTDGSARSGAARDSAR